MPRWLAFPNSRERANLSPLGKLGAPPPLKVEAEEILGIIKGKAPVLKHDEDAAKPKRNSSNARQGGSLTTLRETSSLKTGPVTL